MYEEHKKEQSVSLKGLLDDLENVGISLGTHLSDQTKRNINAGGYFVNAEGSTTVYHGTQKLDLKVEDLESGHNRVDGEHANFSGYGVSFTPTDDNDYGNGVGEKMLSCRLKIDKPFYVIGNLALDDVRSKNFSEILTAHGYDAIITYPNEYAYIHGYADEIVALKRDVIVPIDKQVESDTAQEYTYQLTLLPYGIGSQPDGQLRHIDDGSRFGSVVYDHPLSAEEVKNFSLTPITEAKALEGRTFEVPFGEEKDVYHVDKVDDDGTIHYHVNDEKPLQSRYHHFLSELGDEAKEVKINPETGDEKIRYQKSNGTTHVSESEAIAREVFTDLARKALGDDSVITDGEFGQSVLDEENGKVRRMAFGEPYDYEKYPRGRVEPNLAEKSVSVVKADANHGFTNYKEAKSWAKQNISKTYNNEETGGKGTVRISNAAIDKFLSQSAVDKSESKDVHMSVLKVLPDVLKTSIDAETHPDFLKSENGKRNVENGVNKDVLVHRCYGAVSIDGKPYRVKITLKENVKTKESTNTHSYEATKIELLAGQHGDVTRTSPRYSNNSITAAKLLNGVEMSYDSGKKLLEESEKRSEKVREQRVYHGSLADFDHFDHSHMGEGEGAQVYGWGTYVTEVEGIGKQYAEFVYDINTDLKKSSAIRFLKKYPTLDSFLSDEKIRNNPRSEEEKISYYNENVKASEKFGHHLYTVEIPDDNGHTYLDWIYPVSKEIFDVVKKGLKDFLRPDVDDFREEIRIPEKYSDDYVLDLKISNILQFDAREKINSGKDLYDRLSGYFDSPELASRFLSNIGLVGIKYPANYRNGGRSDGARNYVIFNEKDAQITDHVRYFRTPNGVAYGFTLGGKIYIDPRVATAETPIHEYSHLWATAMQKNNPEEWKNIVGLMKGTSVWEEVKKAYPELTDESEIADEVLATYSGRKGAERLREEMRKAVEGKGSPLEKAEVVSALQRIKLALDKFWKGVADFLHIHYTTAEEVADRVMKDLIHGVDPRKFGIDNKVREQFVGERGAKEADHAEEVTTRLDNLGVARDMEKADKDAKAIKMATGWERGADGKWRYEIPEGKYFPKGDAEYEKVREKQSWSKELDLLSDRIFDGEELSTEENKRFEQLADEEAKFKAEYLTREKPYLADWLKNDELFKSYPELKGVEIVFTDNLPKATSGYYSERDGKIVVNTNSTESTESIIAHEIQHAIQRIEGFARGGNPETIRQQIEDYVSKNEEDVEMTKSTINSAFDLFAKATKLEVVYPKMINSDVEWQRQTATDAYWDALNTIDNGFRHFETDVKNDYSPFKGMSPYEIARTGYHVKETIEELKRISDEYLNSLTDDDRYLEELVDRYKKALESDSDAALYTKLSGEVEARNVERRMSMSPEERRQSLASETEDVSREDQIFLFGEGNSYSVNASEEVDENAQPLLNAIHTLYEKGKDFAAKLFNMKFFDVAKTPDFMKKLGLTGDKFTIRYGVISRHFGKDGEHTLPEEIWEKLPTALKKPFAITKYYTDEKKQHQKGYRLYTSLQLANGAFIVVSAEVKNAGRNIEVNAINTIFGREKISSAHDELIYTSKEITPEQQALLNENNPRQYLEYRELSDAKVGNKSNTLQQSSDKNLYRLKDGTFIKSGSYFSGGGLLEEGLKRYLDPSIAVEFNEKISGVYADNFGNHIVTADVRDVDPRELAKKINGEVQYFHASPVCKNYSRAKREGGEVELDKETAQSTADFISAKRPKVVTIEIKMRIFNHMPTR